MIAYPAKFEKETRGGYVVEFIDIPTCITEGDTIEDAKANAREAISGVLSCMDSRKINIPEPSNIKGKNIFFIKPELKIAFAIRLKMERQKLGLTQKEAAELMHVNWAYYQRIENPRKSNPTLRTIEKLQNVFSCNFFL